jgi:exosortase A-associated hydrolase 1
MNFEERALVFPCNGSCLYGIFTLPEQPSSRGVLIVVGGPQYRVGSHRQFTLLSRYLASYGISTLRFDFRGMGDSEGDARTFEDVEDDLRCAIDKFLAEAPPVRELVIFGLCDAASAALFYAYQDQRVTGLVLLNPWVRTNEGAAQAYLKHYYVSRFFDPELWSKIRQGNFDLTLTARSFLKMVREALPKRKKIDVGMVYANRRDPFCKSAPLPERMLYCLSRFRGKVLFITSGKDLTAREFLDLARSSSEWRKLVVAPHISHLSLPDADHTFSRREWRDRVASGTRNWIRSW